MQSWCVPEQETPVNTPASVVTLYSGSPQLSASQDGRPCVDGPSTEHRARVICARVMFLPEVICGFVPH
jgi:hypothetical protein